MAGGAEGEKERENPGAGSREPDVGSIPGL